MVFKKKAEKLSKMFFPSKIQILLILIIYRLEITFDISKAVSFLINYDYENYKNDDITYPYLPTWFNMNKLNQTESATFAILLFWPLFRGISLYFKKESWHYKYFTTK